MSDMMFENDPLMEFNSLPPMAGVAADPIVSQTQEPYEEEDEQPLQPPESAGPSSVTPPHNAGNGNYVMDQLTTVDGHGMWQSWTRVFDQPRYACLDLLDNCLDATLHPPEFDGKVELKRLPPNGMAILNNSSKPIKALKDVLVVYGSTKGKGANAKHDAIGENGVGLKHGCATLSNSSFVLSRNENVYSLGLIAKTLQSREGVCLPSFEFVIEDPDNKGPAEIEADLYSHLETMITQNPKVAKCVQIDLGQGDLNVGIKSLVEHCQVMWNHKWEQYDHVFQVLITSLLHSHDTHTTNDPMVSRRAFQGNNPAAMFLQEIKDLLPKFYINIPLRGFEFVIENQKVQFSYWQHRLVELTKFNVHIPKETPIQNLTHMNWDKEGYPLSIYCGFEALRVADRDQANATHMYIYSRASGRLIQIDDDARATLGLAASGSDYQQGLTVIVDDVTAELPLMPTKQGIAWSEQRGGETHKRNLLAWASGVCHVFWKHHANTFQQKCGRNDFKTLLNNAVLTFADPIKKHLYEVEQAQLSTRNNNNPGSTIYRSLAMERLELADFTWFRDIDWKKQQQRHNRRWKITKTFGQYNKLDIVEGSATIFKFTAENYPVAQPRQPQYQPPPVQRPPVLPTPHSLVVSARDRMAQFQAQVAANLNNANFSAAVATKKRKLSSGNDANQPILLLDDDESEGSGPTPNPVASLPNGVRKQVARKSTGAPSPQEIMRRNSEHGAPPPPQPQDPLSMQMQMRFKQSQDELARHKHMLANEQMRHRDEVAKLHHQLQQAQQLARHLQQQQLATAHHLPPPNYHAEVQKAKDELTIVNRQKNKLEEELQEIKGQRGTEVSGLNLEIEGLRMKLEQQDEMIKRLAGVSEETKEPEESGSSGFMTRGSLMSSKYDHGTDSI